MSHAKSHARKPSKGTDSQAADSTDSEWLDEAFALLSSSRRRATIMTVMEHENLRKSELVELVTASEYGMSIEQVPGTSERQTVHTSLHQTHLPRLEKADIIEWDEAGDRIKLGPRADELMEFMAHNKDDSLGGKIRRSLSALC